jgi:hypothetical protein
MPEAQKKTADKSSPDPVSPEPTSQGVWPASAADLGIDDPPPTPDEPVDWFPGGQLPEPIRAEDRPQISEPTQTMPAPLKLGKQNAIPSFSAIVRVDGNTGHFEVNASGSADFVTRMVNSFADAFYAESNPQLDLP